MGAGGWELPTGYYLERNPDILILRRSDESFVAAFSAFGVDLEEVQVTTWQDRQKQPDVRYQGTSIHRVAGNPAVLQARFLGCFELLSDGEIIPLRRKGKALAILKYLLAHTNTSVSQDHLMGWLWPESPLLRARSSLSSAIHALRQLLGELPLSATSLDVLFEDGRYRLCPTVRVETDVEEFDVRYKRGLNLDYSGRMAEAASEYESAVELYRDDYLVEDLYEDWTMVERERPSNAYVHMLGRLAAHYMESGRLQESIRKCYEVLEKDRCHADSHYLLMSCLAGLGSYGRASHQYQLFRTLFQCEYGSEPAHEIRGRFEGMLSSVCSY